MANASERQAELAKTQTRAADAAMSSARAGSPAVAMGTLMTEVMGHGGLYTLLDKERTGKRIEAMAMAHMGHGGGMHGPHGAHAMMQHAAAMADMVPTFFFYFLVNKPYNLRSELISFLSYPNRHMLSPIVPDPGMVESGPATPADGAPSAKPYGSVGRTYSQFNDPSPTIPAAMTFLGQFIDHDLTLNAVNLFDDQTNLVPNDASPLIDLDNVYGPRVDDENPGKPREIPMKDGYFCFRRVENSDGERIGFDVCRRDGESDGRKVKVALIGDKRNDENQIVLQVHILAMRLHNAFRSLGFDYCEARRQTILTWQAMILDEYLPLIAQPEIIADVRAKILTGDRDGLGNKPGKTVCGGDVLGMPHEFAIGFRFGHAQIRSEYSLRAPSEKDDLKYVFRLFDSLSDGSTDLQGGKCLNASRIIDWTYFLNDPDERLDSNIIDTKLNEVTFDLPQSAIPDDLKLVGNLAFRNLVRSDSIGVCSGEDLVDFYNRILDRTNQIVRLTPRQVENNEGDPDDPDKFHPLFKQSSCDCPPFRTPLWYYLLREAEVERAADPNAIQGRLGSLGSRLVAEVLLWGIDYGEHSVFRAVREQTPWQPDVYRGGLVPSQGEVEYPDEPKRKKVTLLDIVKFVEWAEKQPDFIVHDCCDPDQAPPPYCPPTPGGDTSACKSTGDDPKSAAQSAG
ncbi:peroxidase family protein [Jiella sonneratiae]|uniref:Peroxidase n=1 Tax=Jiella sonneratiae TaxID=2816856 RepID=A0ABS3J505_9HYPH|nr:peroxidase family protein [Jiella sonneratiae]MBO0904210.1 hypothetical protein [Jiella sonneratiae]